ncbi:hypothetical protein MTO96_003598 [Rhipicephalus appendiculatus]
MPERERKGISGDISRLSTSFPHPCDPSRVVHTVIDPPHIFKCIRNNLLKVGKFLLPGDQEVFHFHYSALLEYEEQQAGLRTVPKLTTAHVNPNPFQKLSVKLAVQLFSESTASGMEFYARRDECKKLHMSAATVQFTRRMNDLYDCLNTKRPQQVQYNEAEHITTLKENIKWLDRWYEYIQTLPKQRQICFLSKPTSEALRLTLHSVVALIEYLLKSGFQYVLVGNFGQDPLEWVRQHGRDDTNWPHAAIPRAATRHGLLPLWCCHERFRDGDCYPSLPLQRRDGWSAVVFPGGLVCASCRRYHESSSMGPSIYPTSV